MSENTWENGSDSSSVRYHDEKKYHADIGGVSDSSIKVVVAIGTAGDDDDCADITFHIPHSGDGLLKLHRLYESVRFSARNHGECNIEILASAFEEAARMLRQGSPAFRQGDCTRFYSPDGVRIGIGGSGELTPAQFEAVRRAYAEEMAEEMAAKKDGRVLPF